MEALKRCIVIYRLQPIADVFFFSLSQIEPGLEEQTPPSPAPYSPSRQQLPKNLEEVRKQMLPASYFFSPFPTLKKCVGTDTFDWPITWIRSKSKINYKEYNLIKIGSDNTTRVSMFDRPGILHTSSRHPPCEASKEAQCRHTHS